jgi:hypothetical protein
LTECGNLSEAEVEETEMAVVAVKTVETADVLEMEAVMIMMVALKIKVVAMLVMTTTVVAVMALIEVAMTERVAVVYRRGCWFVSNVSAIRIMWNITPAKLYHPPLLRPWCCIPPSSSCPGPSLQSLSVPIILFKTMIPPPTGKQSLLSSLQKKLPQKQK